MVKTLAAFVSAMAAAACAAPAPVAAPPVTTTVTTTVTATPAGDPVPPLPSIDQILAGLSSLPAGSSLPVPPAPGSSSRLPAPIPADTRAQVASLMMVGVRNYDDALFALNQGAGGIFIGSWTDPALLTQPGRDIAALHRVVGRPFHVSIDAEGGRVARQPGLFGHLPAPRTMAATMDPQQVEGLAFDMGRKLKAKGIDIDFAPVVDVDGGPAGGAIGDRSFSADPVIAGRYAAAFARGLRNAGVTPVFKHFPGHGRASGDSHTGSVTTPPLDNMKNVDLQAYNEALTVPGAGVMVGHMIVPGLGAPIPSTLNPAVYQLLRSGAWPGGRGFGGLIFTDDISGMKAIADSHTTADAARLAIAAGADIALWISTAELPQVIDTVTRATEADPGMKARVVDAASRVAASYR